MALSFGAALLAAAVSCLLQQVVFLPGVVGDDAWTLPPAPADGPFVNPPPLKKDPNCPRCPENVIPEVCFRLPQPLPAEPPPPPLPRNTSGNASSPTLPDYILPPPARRLLVLTLNRKEAARSLPVYRPLPPEMLARIRANISSWFHGPGPHCGIWTRECARQNVEFGNALGMDREYRIAKQFLPLFPNGPPEDYERLFPDLQPGDLGSCAFVAGGRNLLGMGRGRQIDAHDTVVQFTAPRRGHEADIGTRQDIVVLHERHSGMEKIAPARFYLYMHPASYFKDSMPADQDNFTISGKPVMFTSGYTLGVLAEPYAARHGKPHAGLAIAMSLLGSALCTRLDLYGFSAKGSGHWWDPEDRQEVLGAKHIPGIGRQLFAEAMALGRACVYD